MPMHKTIHTTTLKPDNEISLSKSATLPHVTLPHVRTIIYSVQIYPIYPKNSPLSYTVPLNLLIHINFSSILLCPYYNLQGGTGRNRKILIS
jgi:hypothetical protein